MTNRLGSLTGLGNFFARKSFLQAHRTLSIGVESYGRRRWRILDRDVSNGVSPEGFGIETSDTTVARQLDWYRTSAGDQHRESGRNASNGVDIYADENIVASGNTVGGTTLSSANTIADNGVDGVGIAEYPGTIGTAVSNAIETNTIFGNGNLGIDLGEDGVTRNDV